jgi:hypothetical protein
MTKRIIYPTDEGGVAVIIPSPEWLEQEGNTLETLAAKDVPAGVQFKIVDTSEVPDDRTFRSAWEADMTSPSGVGIGQQSWFIEQYEAEIATINAEQMPARLPDSQQTVEEYDAVVAQWETSKSARIEQLNTQIATQQAEMQA